MTSISTFSGGLIIPFESVQTIAIDEKAGNIQVVTRKTKASPQAVGPAYATSAVRPRSGGRRALGVAAAPAKRGYRPDLRTVSAFTHSFYISCSSFPLYSRLQQRTLTRTLRTY